MENMLQAFPGSEYDTRPPSFWGRRLPPDPAALPYASTSFENTNTHGNARAHYGDVYNYVAASHQASAPPMIDPVFQDDKSAGLDVALLKRALRFDHMNTRLNSMRKAHAGTCEWLLGKEEYKAWRKSPGFLYIKGKPGTGKSTIMKFAHNHGINKFHKDVIVSYFFGSRITRLQSSAEGLYRSLLCQILEKEPQLSASLQKYELRLDQEHMTWHNELLKDLLREAILALGRRYFTCYVDAIDECGHSEAQDIVNFFEELGGSAHEAGMVMRVLISSRHYPQVAIEDRQQIVLEDQTEHRTDLSLYIQSKLRIGDSRKARRIREAVEKRASGVFLWVVLIVQILNEDKIRGRVHHLERRLETLPDDLHQLFSTILQSEPRDVSITLMAFQLLLFAERPLRREELYFALITCDSQDEVQCWDSDEVSTPDMENFILDSSKGLMEIVKGAQPIVQFIHGSVRDYLLDTGLSSLHPATTIDPFALSHDRLKQCCQQHVLAIAPVVLHSPTNGVRASMSKCFR
jgi:dephospho-CoA kinase